MAVKAISEFAIQPGRRDEFVRLFQSLVAQRGEDMRAAGWPRLHPLRGRRRPGQGGRDPAWESAEARERMGQSELMGAFAPLFELAAAPPRATVVEQSPQAAA